MRTPLQNTRDSVSSPDSSHLSLSDAPVKQLIRGNSKDNYVVVEMISHATKGFIFQLKNLTRFRHPAEKCLNPPKSSQ